MLWPQCLGALHLAKVEELLRTKLKTVTDQILESREAILTELSEHCEGSDCNPASSLRRRGQFHEEDEGAAESLTKRQQDIDHLIAKVDAAFKACGKDFRTDLRHGRIPTSLLGASCLQLAITPR